MLEFDVAWSHFDVALGHFDVAWQKLWHKNDVFDEILGCAGHLTLPKKKWAPVAVKIFYKYGLSLGCHCGPDSHFHNTPILIHKCIFLGVIRIGVMTPKNTTLQY